MLQGSRCGVRGIYTVSECSVGWAKAKSRYDVKIDTSSTSPKLVSTAQGFATVVGVHTHLRIWIC